MEEALGISGMTLLGMLYFLVLILVLAESPTYGINRSFGSPVKAFSIKFSKAKTKFFLLEFAW